jgi:hypothetical protein
MTIAITDNSLRDPLTFPLRHRLPSGTTIYGRDAANGQPQWRPRSWHEVTTEDIDRVVGDYLSHVLDECGFPPRMIRSTRLVDLVNTMDPQLVAAAVGMDPQAALIHLADHVDPDRMPQPSAQTSDSKRRNNFA